MDFDFDQIPVPFRMQPGLRRLADDAPLLTRLVPSSALYREKKRVVDAGAALHCVNGFDPSIAISSIAEQVLKTGTLATFDSDFPLALAVEDDLAVLDGANGTVPWMCVCVPSRWAPEDKLGQSLGAIHAPVADSAALAVATQGLIRLVTGGGIWERFVWTITPSARYDQHPGRWPQTPWPVTPDPEEFAARCMLRVERQAFYPVCRGTRQAVFAIRVQLQPLAEAAANPAHARRLHDALTSMSEAVLDYKGLGPARARMCAWLGARAEAGC